MFLEYENFFITLKKNLINIFFLNHKGNRGLVGERGDKGVKGNTGQKGFPGIVGKNC